MDESLAGSPKALSMTNENRLQLAEALQKEVEAFFIVPNLLWAMWAMAQSVSTKITFGYWVRNNTVENPCPALQRFLSQLSTSLFAHTHYWD